MHTVELLEQAISLAERLGFQIRHEWLGGQGGGLCEFSGKRWIFIDLGLTSVEQLDQVVSVLRNEPSLYLVELNPPLRKLLDVRRSA